MLLAEVEARTGRPVAECFDLIAGTSTGAILALGLAKPGADGEPEYSARDLVGLYEREGARIFSRSVWHRVRSVGGAADEKYLSEAIDGVLDEYFGHAMLSESLTDVLVPAYELVMRDAFFFKSRKAKVDRDYDFRLRDVARATSAAPTYFEPVQLATSAAIGTYTLVDGGVFANNPAMCAWTEASSGGTPADALLLSLGTGELTRPMPWEEVRDWGLLDWARPILNVVMDGVSDATDHQLLELLGAARYLRLTTTLEIGSDDLDDAAATNIHALKAQAQRIIDKRSGELDALCARLVR